MPSLQTVRDGSFLQGFGFDVRFDGERGGDNNAINRDANRSGRWSGNGSADDETPTARAAATAKMHPAVNSTEEKRHHSQCRQAAPFF